MRPELVKSIDQEQMTAWGELSGDRNPLHVEPRYAQSTRYGGTIAHGHLVVAWVAEWLAADSSPAGLTGLQLKRLRFRAPVRPGHRYVVRGRDGGVEIVDEEDNVVLTAGVLEGAEEDRDGEDA